MIFVRMKKGDNSPHFTNNIKSLNLQKLQTSIDNSETNIFLKGLHGSSKSFLINSLFSNLSSLTIPALIKLRKSYKSLNYSLIETFLEN